MKKFLKFFCVFCFLICCGVFSFGCDEGALQSISFSIVKNSNGENVVYKDGYFNMYIDDIVEIAVEIKPSSFTINDFNWTSSNNNVVAVNYNKITAVGIGNATITASCKNSDGKTISASANIKVLSATNNEITFSEELCPSSLVYNGYDQKYVLNNSGEAVKQNVGGVEKEIQKFKCNEDDGSGKYEYQVFYYDWTIPSGETYPIGYGYKEYKYAEIKNAGKYRIICSKVEVDEGGNKKIVAQATKEIEITKYKLSLETPQFNEIEYGDNLPTTKDKQNQLYNENDTNKEYKALKGVGGDSKNTIFDYRFVTKATVGSIVGSYFVSVNYQLNSDNEELNSNNYESEINFSSGLLKIKKKNVFIQIQDQTITYGDSIKGNYYTVYGAKEKGGGDTTLVQDNDNVLWNGEGEYYNNIYAKNVDLQNATYYKTDKATEIRLNSLGLLNVIDTEGEGINKFNYYLDYPNCKAKNTNINICGVERGKILVSQREIKIVPMENQGKTYLSADPDTIGYNIKGQDFVKNDNIIQFLSIDYGSGDVYLNYYLKTVGNYGYKINHDINSNYNIKFADDCNFEEGNFEDINNKYKFTISQCNIDVRLTNIVDKYVSPSGAGGVHTVNYYGSTADYTTTIASLKIDDNTIVNQNVLINNAKINNDIIVTKSENFDSDGKFCISVNDFIWDSENDKWEYNKVTIDLSFLIGLEKVSNARDGYCESYNSNDASAEIEIKDGDSIVDNFKVKSNKITVDLTKITITIVPNMSDSTFKKVYDGTTDLPTGFGTIDNDKGINCYELQGEFLDGDNNLSNILKTSKGNSFNSINDSLLVVNVTSGGEIKDVCKYTVFLQEIGNGKSLQFVDGKEYYEFVLDNSQDYYFEITPATLTITPTGGQSKVCGNNDGDLSFTVSGFVGSDSESLKVAGTGLNRVQGENVGSYQIGLGNLSFGNNYICEIYEIPINFEITKRTINVTPTGLGNTTNFEIIYGENLPAIGYKFDYDGTIDETLNFDRPNFSGVLGIDGVLVNKYYPVKTDGSGYDIVQNTLSCNNNFEINFVEGSTITVKPREVFLNIISTKVETTDYRLSSEHVLDNAKYYVDLVNGETCIITVNADGLNENTGFYELNGYSIVITYQGQELTNCYNVSLGSNIIYTVDKTIVDVVWADGFDNLKNEVTTMYNAKDRNGSDDIILKPVLKTSTYKVSSYELEYNGSSVLPKKAGSYIVKVKSISIKISETETITFERKADKEDIDYVSGNYVLNFSNLAYITIEKANITLDTTKTITLTKDFVYGGNELSNINNISECFSGVVGDTLSLKYFDIYNDAKNEVNFSYNTSIYDVSKFEVGGVNIIQAIIEDNSGNYKPLTFELYIDVKSQEISYEELFWSSTALGYDKTTTYNGKSVDVTLSIDGYEKEELEAKNCQFNYSYYRIKVEEYNGVSAKVKTYNADTFGEDGGVKTFGDMNPIKVEMSGDFLVFHNTGGTKFAVRLENNQTGEHTNSGIYYCVLSCSVSSNSYGMSNYSFKKGDGDTTNYVSGFALFEIKKAKVDVSWDKDNKFEYGTLFDFNNISSLPFVFSVTPKYFKNYVKISYNGLTTTQRLNVGTHSVNISLEEDPENENYYLSETKSFVVTKKQSDIILPITTSYTYTGSEITSMLSRIGIVLRDENGAYDVIYYSSGDANFTLTFTKYIDGDGKEFTIYFDKPNKMFLYDDENEIIENGGCYSINSKELIYDGDNENYYYENDGKRTYINSFKVAPIMPGKYVLEISYDGKDTNYTGEATFEYEIVGRMSYEVIFVKSEIEYDPSSSAEKIYNLILEKMFSIRDFTRSEYKVSLTDITCDVKISENDVVNVDGDNFKKYYKKLKSGSHTLEIKVDFVDPTYKSYIAQADLNIKDKELSLNMLDFSTTQSEFTYDGYRKYYQLALNGISLTPNISDGMTTYEGLNINYCYDRVKNEFIFMDNLGNTILKIGYKYYRKNGTGAYDEMASGEYPISPEYYKISYTILLGDNYSGGYLIQKINVEKEFRIKKVGILYISISDSNKFSYTGKEIDFSLIKQNIIVKNNPNYTSSNMNFYIISSNSAYDEEKGVGLYINFVDKDCKTLTSIYEIGKYTVNLSLIENSSYKWSNYFENIKIGTTQKAIGDYNPENDKINNTLNIVFNSVKSLPISVVEVEGSMSINDDGNKFLSIKNGTQVNVSADFSIEVYNNKECSGTKLFDLTSGYTFYLRDSDHIDSFFESGVSYWFKVIINGKESSFRFKVVN